MLTLSDEICLLKPQDRGLLHFNFIFQNMLGVPIAPITRMTFFGKTSDKHIKIG